MALRYVEYKRRQWVLRFRDPWSGKQRVRSFFAEAEAKAFEAIQAELYARERELIRVGARLRRRRHARQSRSFWGGTWKPLKIQRHGARLRSISNR